MIERWPIQKDQNLRAHTVTQISQSSWTKFTISFAKPSSSLPECENGPVNSTKSEQYERIVINGRPGGMWSVDCGERAEVLMPGLTNCRVNS